MFDDHRLAHAAAEQTAQRLRRLQEVSSELVGARTVDAVVRAMVERGLGALGAVAGAMWTLDREAGRLRLRGHVGYPDEVVVRFTDLPLDAAAPAAEAGREGRRILLESVAERDARYPQLAGGASAGTAFLAEPLSEDGEVIGVLAASLTDGRALADPANADFLDTVVSQCAVALHRATGLEAERASRLVAERSARRLARLQEFTARLSELADAARLSETTVAMAIEETGASFGVLALVAGDRMHIVREHGMNPQVLAAWGEFPLDESMPAGEAVLSQRTVVVRGLAERDARYPALRDVPPTYDHTLVCLPLTVGDHRLGALTLTFPGLEPLDGVERAFLESIADQCAHGLERTRLLALEERARTRLELLAEAGRLFASQNDVAAICREACRLAVQRIADTAAVHLFDDEERLLTLVSECSDSTLAETQRRLVARLPDRVVDLLAGVAHSGVPRLETTTPDEASAVAGEDAEVLLAAMDVRSTLVLPMHVPGRALGVLTMSTLGDRAPFGPDDLSEMTELAGRLSLALENARLFQHSQEVAQTLQRSLLPGDRPIVPGVDVAVRYLPGTTGVTVGGDFYDFFPLPSGRVGLVVGDVMGRGVHAAALMGQVRAAVRSYALEGHRPAPLLDRLDRLVASLQEGLIVTCVYGEWDAEHRRLTVSCAGHLPPLVRLPGEEPRFLEVEPGVPLGVGLADHDEYDIVLPPGSLLLAYTDGLVEARVLPVEEGMAALAAAVTDVAGADAACDAALAAMRPLGDDDRRYDDDTAVLALWTVDGDPGEQAQRAERRESVGLAADPHSPARARAVVEATLQRWGMGGLAEVATLLVSEAVTNAVRHAGTHIELVIERVGDDRVRIAVTDEAPRALLRQREPDAAAEGGRGLHLVDHLADRWGVSATASTKTVWFELTG